MGWGICVSDGNWYLTGSFENDILIGDDQLVSRGSSDVLLAGSGQSIQNVNYGWVVNGEDFITYQLCKGGELTVCYRKPLQAGQHLFLYDLGGKLLYHDVMKNITHIPVVGFKGGLYILKVASNNGEKMATRKILIQ